MEKDFVKFLLDIEYASHTANVYLWKVKKFAAENGYNNLTELADDVFILLDQGKHGDRKFDADTLSAINRYKNVLVLFNSFLFDIGYRRKFVIPLNSNPNIMRVLATDQPYIPGVQPRTLADIENGKKTQKQWFSPAEVMAALHVSHSILDRWAKASEEDRRKKCIPNKHKGREGTDIDLSYWKGNRRGEYRYTYYRLDELNDFLEYLFDYGTETQREQRMSDTDIRKSTKRAKKTADIR